MGAKLKKVQTPKLKPLLPTNRRRSKPPNKRNGTEHRREVTLLHLLGENA